MDGLQWKILLKWDDLGVPLFQEILIWILQYDITLSLNKHSYGKSPFFYWEETHYCISMAMCSTAMSNNYQRVCCFELQILGKLSFPLVNGSPLTIPIEIVNLPITNGCIFRCVLCKRLPEGISEYISQYFPVLSIMKEITNRQ